jgi:hypothetical protein
MAPFLPRTKGAPDPFRCGSEWFVVDALRGAPSDIDIRDGRCRAPSILRPPSAHLPARAVSVVALRH